MASYRERPRCGVRDQLERLVRYSHERGVPMRASVVKRGTRVAKFDISVDGFDPHNMSAVPVTLQRVNAPLRKGPTTSLFLGLAKTLEVQLLNAGELFESIRDARAHLGPALLDYDKRQRAEELLSEHFPGDLCDIVMAYYVHAPYLGLERAPLPPRKT